MKLTTFNTQTVETNTRVSKPRILFSTGSTVINSFGVELLNLKPGSRISIHQEDGGGDFFLSIGDPAGFELRVSKSASKGLTLCFNCAALARGIIKALANESDNSIGFQIIEEPQETELEWSKKPVKIYLLCHLPKKQND